MVYLINVSQNYAKIPKSSDYATLNKSPLHSALAAFTRDAREVSMEFPRHPPGGRPAGGIAGRQVVRGW